MRRNRLSTRWAAPGLSVAILATACGASPAQDISTLPPPPSYGEARRSTSVTGEAPPANADDYVARALGHSPAARSALARWEAAHEGVRASQRWPRPTLGYAYLARPLHTRAGPLRQRVSFAWPLPLFGVLSAAQNGAEAEVLAASHRFAAVALTVRAQVAEAYWRLWEARERATVLEAQVELLMMTAEVLRGRVATGAVSLAALQQLELRRTRLIDALLATRTHEAHRAAHLAEVVELATPPPTVAEAPAIRVPGESKEALLAAAGQRPEVAQELARAIAFRERAAGFGARRRPQASLRMEWSEVGPSVVPGVQNGGEDALALGVTVALPLDVGADRAAERAAEAQARAAEEAGGQAEREARLEVLAALAEVQNTARSAHLYESSLEPQAAAAFESATARMATEGDVALVLLALRELLEVRLGRIEALAAHAIAWARLERAVGRPVVVEPWSEEHEEVTQ